MIFKNYVRCVVIFIGLLPMQPVLGESLSERQEFTHFLYELQDALILKTDNKTPRTPAALFSKECQYPSSDLNPDKAIQNEQARLYRIDKGVELRGGYSSGNLSDAGNDTGDVIQGQTNIEVSWDLLKSGFFQNKSRSNTHVLKAREAEKLMEFKSIKREFRCRDFTIKKEFTGVLTQLLVLQLKFLEKVYNVERRAYFKQWSSLDDYLVSEQDLVLTKLELDQLNADPYFDDAPYSATLPPIIDINLAGLLKRIRQDKKYDVLFDIREKILRSEADSIHHDSFSIYIRQEFADKNDTGDEDELVGGMRFRIPLFIRDSNLMTRKLNKLEQSKANSRWERIAATRSAYWRFKEQLQRVIKNQYQEQRAGERLRQTLLLLKRGEKQLLTSAITRMNAFIKSRYDLIISMESLYEQVNNIFGSAQLAFSSDLVTEIPITNQLVRARPGKRSIYIWSKAFNTTSNDDLIAFIEAKSNSTVLLSAGKKIHMEKQKRFIERLTQKNIAVELIIGDNSWIFEHKHNEAVEKSLIAGEVTGRIHFDIEPQSMPDYQQNKADYLRLYVDLVRKTKKGLIDRHLSLAVPFHWPEATYSELADIADQFYIMAYGTLKPETMSRRINRILQIIPAEKCVVVLNIKEFPDEWRMEQMISNIINTTKINQFCTHDLKNFIMKL